MKRWMRSAVLAMALLCSAAIAAPAPDETATQIMRHAGDHRLVVLGEYHGTAETPLLVADLMERYSRNTSAVRLALELPMSENIALARYLRSDGDEDAREKLRTSPFWAVKDDQHDGRRSRDMLALIEAVRVLRARAAMWAWPAMTTKPAPPPAATSAMRPWPHTCASSSVRCLPMHGCWC